MKDVVRGTDDGEGSAKLVHQVQVRFKLSDRIVGVVWASERCGKCISIVVRVSQGV